MQLVKFHPKVLVFYSEVSDGNIDNRFSPPKEVRQNRQNIFLPHKINYREAIETAQIHSDRILFLNPENTKMWRGVNVTGVDGFITAQTDAYLMIRVADCVPVVIYDPVNHVVGLFHAGWRGTVKGIHTSGLARMVKDAHTNPKDVVVWLGPCAHACHYQVTGLPQQATDPAWKDCIKKTGSTYHVDLIKYIVSTLRAASVLKANIHDANICTYEAENLFSHQRAKDKAEAEGRFAVVVKLQ